MPARETPARPRYRHLDQSTVEVETAPGSAGDDDGLAERFARALKGASGVAAEVRLLAPQTLPRATHEAKRVDDRRRNVRAG